MSDSTETAVSSPRFHYATDWGGIAPADAQALRAFWKREGALADDAQIDARLPQVVMHATTRDGEVAGVCTALATTHPRIGQPLYYWRTFVGKPWRSSPLVGLLLRKSCRVLEEHAAKNDFPCIGVLLELENARFKERGRAPVWANPRFVYIGRSERNLDLRVLYFDGAKLKSPQG